MGLIKAALGAGGGVLGDQWKDYFYCDAIPETLFAVQGQKRVSSRSSNRHGSDNVITTGSVIAVADGQCMLIVDQGRIAEICSEPGEFVYDASTEPSIFCGNLGEGISKSFAAFGRRFTFGGEPAKDQRVYYINTKEMMGNKYGTPSPVPFRVIVAGIGRELEISIRCFGEYSYRITDPILFYKNVCGNFSGSYERSRLDSQMKSELLTALQPAFGRLSEKGIRYSALPAHTMELADALNDVLDEKWRARRGIEIAEVGVSSVKASEEDEALMKQMQNIAVYTDPNMREAQLATARAAAIQDAAKNTASGPMIAMAGMNITDTVGGRMQAQSGYGYPPYGAPMGQQPYSQPAPAPASAPAPAPAAPAADSWTCSCGHTATGKFCPECGSKKPEPKPAQDSWTCTCGHVATGKFCPECGSKRPEQPAGWVCSCGAVNKGKFCPECGSKKPAAEPLYRCDKCGWEPADPKHPPRFCPECGDPFDEGDIR